MVTVSNTTLSHGIRSVLLAYSFSIAITPTWAAQGLGDLAGGTFSSLAYGVSSDGAVVVGRGQSANGGEAFRWTQAGGMVGLGDLAGGGFYSIAFAVSGDGAVVVGRGTSANGIEAFRWTQAGGMVALGDLTDGGFSSLAYGVSSDGAVVVGRGESANGKEAFRWTQAGGMEGLGDLAGGTFFSVAYDASSDGAVVVGRGQSANGGEAFRWTQAGGMVGLGDLAGGSFYSLASRVSDDGTVVVGQSSSINGTEVFRWTQAGGMVGLGDLTGGSFFSQAYGLNDDGTVVVGKSESTNGTEAFRWTQAGGMVTVAEWLTTAGVSLGGLGILEIARGVSADGNTVVGTTDNSEAYIARVTPITPAASGIVGLTDLSNSIVQSFAVTNQLQNLTSLTINGAHHRPLTDMAVGNANGCAWVRGDLGHVHRSANGETGIGELGVCYDLPNQSIRIGGGVGASFSNLELNNGGNSRLNGQYGVAELDWQLPIQPVIASLLAVYGQWDADLKRGYAIAGTKTSRGETDVTAYSLRARLDWKNAFSVSGVNVSPRIAYTATRTEVDSYQEKGGTAPASFKEQAHTAKELRAGLTANYAVSEKTTLLGHFEAIHRFDKRGSNIAGNINALGVNLGFDLEGNEVKTDWVRLGAEINYRLSKHSVINASSFVSSAGEDADITAAVSYHVAF